MKRQRILASMLAMGLLLALAVGLSLAQGPEPPADEVQPQGDLSVTGSVASTISYQGMLTENDSPVDGSRNMIFRLYSDDACSTQVGSDINAGSVQVNDGFFDVDLAVDQDDFDGQSLWLEAEVGGTTIGCEEIQPVPYALSLRPGAQVIGNDSGSLLYVRNQGGGSSLHGVNLGDGPGVTGFGLSGAGVEGYSISGAGVEGYSSITGTGVYGESTDGHGVHGKSTGGYGGYFEGYTGVRGQSTDGYGVYGKSTDGTGVSGISTDGIGVIGLSSNNDGVYARSDSSDHAAVYAYNNHGVALMAAGSGIISSTADSILYLSPHDMVVRGSTGVELTPLSSGGVEIRYTSIGDKYLSIPVSTFGTLFGAPLYVKEIEVCYDTEPNADIEFTSVIKNDGSTGSTNYIYDVTERTSSTHDCYTVVASMPRVVIDNSTWVQFNISVSSFPEYTHIYTVKLTLTEQQD
jgi:hypothetical protein